MDIASLLAYAAERTAEVVEVVWNLPFFWIEDFTWGEAAVAVLIIIFTGRIFFKIFD